MRVLWMMAIVGLVACQPTPPPAPVAITATQAVADGTMRTLLNRERTARGRNALVEDSRLSRAARDHAQDMVNNDYFSHTGRDGSSFSDRAQAAGYSCAAAENVAFGQRSEAEVVSGWMMSQGHRRNILLEDVTQFGIGQVGTMWVLMLGRGC